MHVLEREGRAGRGGGQRRVGGRGVLRGGPHAEDAVGGSGGLGYIWRDGLGGGGIGVKGVEVEGLLGAKENHMPAATAPWIMAM